MAECESSMGSGTLDGRMPAVKQADLYEFYLMESLYGIDHTFFFCKSISVCFPRTFIIEDLAVYLLDPVFWTSEFTCFVNIQNVILILKDE